MSMSGQRGGRETSPHFRIDHAIFGAGDIDALSDSWVARYGLASVPGGRHVGHGTANRIVPLGNCYLELMGVVDEREAALSSMGAWVQQSVSSGEAWMAWCVATDDIEAVCRRLELSPVSMQRRRPDGVVLSWRLAGLDIAMSDSLLPFFIQWDVGPQDHPGRARADHSHSVSGIAAVELGGDARRLDGWLGEHDLPLRFVDGPDGVAAVEVAGDRRTRIG